MNSFLIFTAILLIGVSPVVFTQSTTPEPITEGFTTTTPPESITEGGFTTTTAPEPITEGFTTTTTPDPTNTSSPNISSTSIPMTLEEKITTMHKDLSLIDNIVQEIIKIEDELNMTSSLNETSEALKKLSIIFSDVEQIKQALETHEIAMKDFNDFQKDIKNIVNEILTRVPHIDGEAVGDSQTHNLWEILDKESQE